MTISRMVMMIVAIAVGFEWCISVSGRYLVRNSLNEFFESAAMPLVAGVDV
jgi:hypothetical protein